MIAAVENAILARLKALSDADVLGYQWKTLESSPDDWATLFTEKVSSIRTPAAWTAFAGWDATAIEDSGQIRIDNARFVIVLASRNLRNETEARHGSAVGEPGSYQLMLDAVSALRFNDLGLSINPLRIGAAREVARTEAMRRNGLSVFALDISTDIWLAPAEAGVDDGDTPSDFLRLHADWDIRPFGGVGPDLPDEANADASDLVTLEGPQP